jgi:hypothetical protein
MPKFKDLKEGTWIWDGNENCVWVKIHDLTTEDEDHWVNAICVMSAPSVDEYSIGPGCWASWNPEAEVVVYEGYELVVEAVFKKAE